MLKTNFWAFVVSFLCFWPWNEQWKSTKSSWLTFSVRVAASINIRPGHNYYFYVRSVNTVGKSAFVEAVGQPSDDASGYLDFFKTPSKTSHLTIL
ncbi:TPA: hypothetical protein JLL26_003341 [Escherichia coli]|nr:hypothetical protein [Escherichia coli]HAW1099330.1 hypothetical protein [Escherichia coli]HCI8576799.1 hypothetical protein [Escherichia coli]